MVDVLQDYAAELSSCRITPGTRSKYSYYQVKIITSTPAKLRLEAVTPAVVGELLASCDINGKRDKEGNTSLIQLTI